MPDTSPATTISLSTTPALHGPYEDLAIELIQLIGKIIDSQPKEVQVALWNGYLEDVKAWRDFCKALRLGFGTALVESAHG